MDIRPDSEGSHRKWRLRTRLSLALLLVFIPVLALAALTQIEAFNERRDAQVDSLIAIDQTIAASIEGFARDLETFSKSTSITLSLAAAGGVPLNQQTFGPYFAELAKSYNVRSIFIVDQDGRVLAGTAGNVGFDVSSRPYFIALKQGSESVWSGALAGQLSGQTTLAYGRPVTVSDGPPIAYLIIAFYPPQIADRLPQDLPADASVTLIDNGGVVLLDSRNQDPQAPTISIAESELFDALARGREVTVRDDELPIGAGKQYGAFTRIELNGWAVGLSRPASAVNGPLQATLLRDLSILTAVFTSCLGLMVFISARLSHPLTKLAQTASAIARGEPATFAESASDHDLAQLQSAMTQMSKAIAEREDRLRQETADARRLANQLARLHASRNALARLQPPNDICNVVVREAVTALDAVLGAVYLPGESGSSLRLVASIGYPDEVLGKLSKLDLSEASPTRDAFTGGRLIIFEKAEAQSSAYPNRASIKESIGTEASAFLPLVANQKVLGVLSLGFGVAHRPSQEDQDLMTAFANQAAQALDRAQLYEAEQLTRGQLEALVASKDEFLGILAHELRTPVTTIYGSAKLLNNLSRKLPDSSRAELMASLEAESERMVHLIENLLTIARLELGPEQVLGQVSIDELVDETLADLDRNYPGREILVTNRLGAASTILSSRTSLMQIIYNLLSNAAKYSPLDQPIELVFDGERDKISISVLDRGPGVAPKELPLIFQSFYRSPASAGTASGKGIGLTVCRRLVESLGGSITAKLRDDGGLEMQIELPQVSSEVPVT